MIILMLGLLVYLQYCNWCLCRHGYPEPLGKFETGSKAALPIFEEFVKKAVKKSDARPFKVPDAITLMVVDPDTGTKQNLIQKIQLLSLIKAKTYLMEKFCIQITID